jgi:hypothetical protein
MKTTYCKNCKWCGFRRFEYLGDGSWLCRLKTNNWFDTNYKDSDIETSGLTNDFNCNKYKRTWYKFWVR